MFKCRASAVELTNFLVCAAAAISAGLSLFVWNPVGVLSVLFFLLFCGFSFLSAKMIFSREAEPGPAVSRNTALLYALFTALALYTRFRGISTLELWSDEDNQDWFLFRKLEIAQRAAWAQQPALHHFLSLPLVKAVANKLFAIRFFPALFGSLAVPLFFSLLRKTCRNKYFAFLGAFAFLANGSLISYAKEGKPNSMAVFFTVLYLHALHGFLQKVEGVNRPTFPRAWVALVVTSSLLFFSIGIQPLLVGEAFTIAFGFLYLAAGRPRIALQLALAALLGICALSPFLYETYRISLSFGFLKTARPWNALSTEFSEQWWVHFAVWRELLFGLPLAWLAPLGIFSSLWLLKSKPSLLPRFQLGVLLASLLLPILGLLTYVMIVKVNVPVPRYFLVFLPVWIAAMIYALDLLPAGPWLSRGIALLASIAVAAGAWASYSSPSAKPTEKQIPELYAYFHRADLHAARAYYLTLNTPFPAPGKFMQIGFYGKDYYGNDLEGKVILESQFDNLIRYGKQLDRLFEDIEKNPETSDIFFYSMARENDALFEKYHYSPNNQPELIQLGNPDPHDWASGVLIRLPNRYGFRETVKKFFIDLDREEKNPAVKQKVLVVLGMIAIAEGNCASAKAYLRQVLPSCYENVSFCAERSQIEGKFYRTCPEGGFL